MVVSIVVFLLIIIFPGMALTQDFNELKQIGQDNLNLNFQIVRKNDKLNIPENENEVLSIRTKSQINALSMVCRIGSESGEKRSFLQKMMIMISLVFFNLLSGNSRTMNNL